MKKIKAKILEKNIEAVSINNGSNRYGLILKLSNSNTKFGIYLGVNNMSSEIKYYELLDTINTYTFFIDNTVIEKNGINLGIRKITLNNKTIYRDTRVYNLIGGIIFILLSIAGTVIIRKFKNPDN